MDAYIRLERLNAFIMRELRQSIRDDSYNLGKENAYQHILDELPRMAEEAKPVNHGLWIWADDMFCRCSESLQKAPVIAQYQDEPATLATAYCPNCGAKMDMEVVP